MLVETTEEPLRERSLTLDVYSRLRADILSGQLAPSLKLKLAVLTERYGAGASPIREALSRLSAEQLVEKLDNRGFRVSPVSRAELDDIVRARRLLEDDALRASIARGDETWEDRLTAAFFRLDRTNRKDPRWEALHRRFHETLLDRCGSNIILGYCSELYDLAIRYRNIARTNARSGRDVNAEHRRIYDAAIARDCDAAAEALLAHYAATAAAVEL